MNTPVSRVAAKPVLAMRNLMAALAFLAAAIGLAPKSDAGPQYAVALNGYDVVAYFKGGKPTRGSTNSSYFWNGAVWLFSSPENREAFVKNPESFAPEYDGYCAFAAARGLKAPTDPLAWHIHDGKLYMNLNAQVQKRWLSDIDNEIKKADDNWKKIGEI